MLLALKSILCQLIALEAFLKLQNIFATNPYAVIPCGSIGNFFEDLRRALDSRNLREPLQPQLARSQIRRATQAGTQRNAMYYSFVLVELLLLFANKIKYEKYATKRFYFIMKLF